MLFCRHYFSLLDTLMRKGKDPVPDPHLLLIDPDRDGQKTCGCYGSDSGSGSPTMLLKVSPVICSSRVMIDSPDPDPK
jgi:hypothetical protein